MENVVCARFFGGPFAVREARGYVRRVLNVVDLGDVLDDVLLVVSEVATNAVVHAGMWEDSFLLRIEADQQHVRVECRDNGSGLPHRQRPDVDDTGGRGLVLVEQLSARWGIDLSHRAGKAVWFEVDLKCEGCRAC